MQVLQTVNIRNVFYNKISKNSQFKSVMKRWKNVDKNAMKVLL